ncbi:hypothetical protein JTE90_011058 [Oedothorax gibbosus]|uniref:Uncharacterized protein n=1 Tax=Oedothorax gibbosus TaxID=931172 RepID=A0AAV6VEW8_9ARAC|nr:hypothetical protein JTE90_011058 [Oedothorax gibbosus]
MTYSKHVVEKNKPTYKMAINVAVPAQALDRGSASTGHKNSGPKQHTFAQERSKALCPTRVLCLTRSTMHRANRGQPNIPTSNSCRAGRSYGARNTNSTTENEQE